MINRGALILKYRAPAIRWINEADPCSDDPGVTQSEVNRERTIYLISDEDADGSEAAQQWLRLNYQELFESELEGWYTDPKLWPRERTWSLFQDWFAVECHSVILDTVRGKICDDEA